MRNIILILFLISCNQIEKTSVDQNKSKETNSIKHDNIDHFFFFKKGMSVSDVHNVLKSHKIKYGNLNSASKVLSNFTFVNDDFDIKNLINYFEINDFIAGDKNFGKLYVFFINNELYRLSIRHDFYNSFSLWRKGNDLGNWLNSNFNSIDTLVKNLERKYPNFAKFGITNVDSLMSRSEILINSGPSITNQDISYNYHIDFGSRSDVNLTNNKLYVEFFQSYYYAKTDNNDFKEIYFHELFVNFKSVSINNFIQKYLNNQKSKDSINKMLQIQKQKKLLDDI